MGSGFAAILIACASVISSQVLLPPRPIRFQYSGAIYHVTARGDGGKTVFETDDVRKSLVYRLSKVCGGNSWRVCVWVLMANPRNLYLADWYDVPPTGCGSGVSLNHGSIRSIGCRRDR